MEFLICQEIDLGRVNPVYRYEQPMEHGDGQAHRWCVAIRKDGKAADLTGMNAKCYVTRAANAAEKAKGVSIVSVVQDANVDAEGGTVECTFESGCYAGMGAMKCVMRLYDGAGSAMATAKMTAVLERSTSDAVYDPEGLVPSMEALLAQIATIETATKNAAEAAGAANTAAERADESAERADDAAQAIEGMTVSARSAAAPGAAISERDGVKHIVFDLVTPRITFEVETGAAGTNVEIEQSGTPEAPVVKLTIPRGDTGNIDGLDYYEGNPAALGTASPGTANGVARGNHVHPMPSAADVGARPATWMPSAADVGALPSGGTAVNSSKLGDKTWAELMLTVYPVGSIYMSVNSANPGSLFGGTWEQLKDRFLLGAGDTYANGNTGGAATVSLTSNQIAEHVHTLSLVNPDGTEGSKSTSYIQYGYGGEGNTFYNNANAMGKTGGGEPHDNMPPYLVVYMWKRTA